MARTQQSEDLTVAEALKLLGGVRFGRVVFTSRALPAVRPVRHVVAAGQIIITAGPELVLGSSTSKGSGLADETIVAYEADQLDSTGCSGWTVVIVGRARPVTVEADVTQYRLLLPAVTVPDQLVAIRTDVVTGFRLVAGGDPVAAGR